MAAKEVVVMADDHLLEEATDIVTGDDGKSNELVVATSAGESSGNGSNLNLNLNLKGILLSEGLPIASVPTALKKVRGTVYWVLSYTVCCVPLYCVLTHN